MQSYYFYQHPTGQHIFVQKTALEHQEAEFIWLDFTREDLVNRAEHWQKELYELTQLWVNEYHLRDILNLDHPCTFDALDDYDLLIFRKLITRMIRFN